MKRLILRLDEYVNSETVFGVYDSSGHLKLILWLDENVNSETAFGVYDSLIHLKLMFWFILCLILQHTDNT